MTVKRLTVKRPIVTFPGTNYSHHLLPASDPDLVPGQTINLQTWGPNKNELQMSFTNASTHKEMLPNAIVLS